MKKRVSLKDISNAVGVSVSLVSYVLNNKGKENRVSEDTAEKIRKVAKELNYTPNYIARSLKNKKSNTIGLIVADISNPFFSNLARTVEDEASIKNYTVIFGSSDEQLKKFKNVLDFLTSRQVDGFIIAPTEGSKEVIEELDRQQIPYVLIDRYFEEINSNFVVIDNFQASFESTEYLIKKGHNKIGIVTYESDLYHYEKRIDGYLKALENHDIEYNDNLIKRVNYSNVKEEMGIVVDDLIKNDNVEAILFVTNSLALVGIKEIISLGVKIQEEVDVVVFDQTEGYEFFSVPIPYIKQPIHDMAKEAVRILLDQIENKVNKISKVQLKADLNHTVPNVVNINASKPIK